MDAGVFGVDIQSGDPRGSASYALVRLGSRDKRREKEDNRIKRDIVSRRKLLRLIAKENPELIAVDNIFEIAENKNELIKLLRNLPVETKLVQVTGDENPEPLARVASRHDVKYGKKPMQEAEAAARLGIKRVGYEVSAFEDKTNIKVSRGRSIGKGGRSQDRYTRKIHGAVRREARKIEEKLKGFEYESEKEEAYGGLSKAEFLVESSREHVPINPYESGDVQVNVDPIERDGIEFIPLKKRDYVVVGIDPGTTTAVSIINLGGRVEEVSSSRSASIDEIIEWIAERGRPVLVCSDVSQMPSAVEKIKRTFDAAGWTPQNDLEIEQKKSIAGERNNEHERDATAAALSGFKEHEEQFKRIEEKAKRSNVDAEKGKVIKKVLTEGKTVETVLDELSEEEEKIKENQEPKEETRETRLERRAERLKDKTENLEGKLKEKEKKIEKLEGKLAKERRKERKRAIKEKEVDKLRKKKIKTEKKLKEKEKKNKELKQKIKKLKNFWTDIPEGYKAVKPIDEFTLSAIRKKERDTGLSEGDIILLKDASGAGKSTAEKLASINPKLVLKHGRFSEVAEKILFENEIPVYTAEKVEIKEIDELKIIKEKQIEKSIKEWKEKAEKRKKKQKKDMVDEVINEYRAERKS